MNKQLFIRITDGRNRGAYRCGSNLNWLGIEFQDDRGGKPIHPTPKYGENQEFNAKLKEMGEDALFGFCSKEQFANWFTPEFLNYISCRLDKKLFVKFYRAESVFIGEKQSIAPKYKLKRHFLRVPLFNLDISQVKL